MVSIRAKLLNQYLRRRMKPLPLADIEPFALRSIMNRAAAPLPPSGVEIEAVSRSDSGAPVSGEWLRPQSAPSGQNMIFYMHGGGYVFCSPRTHRGLTMRLAKFSALPVFSLDYRLAPEHPCPAAIEDALAAWDWLTSDVNASARTASEIFIAGDSAGGGLCLALLQALKAAGRPLPAGAILYSPWTDLSSAGASIIENADRDAMFHADALRRGGARYAGGLPLTDPRVSPLYGDLSGLSPMLVFASTVEALRDDSVRLVDKVRLAGGRAEFRLEPALPHVWPLFAPLIPEAGVAIERSAEFIRSLRSHRPAPV